MEKDQRFVDAGSYKVKPNETVKLSDWNTDYEGERLNKEIGTVVLEAGRKELAEVQEKLYAQNRYSILIILQAMDAAGKDSAIKHIMTGFSPIGVNVHSFKTPSAQELDHYYLWRHVLALPPRGEIAIHNRSHYENVLVTRVHPEYILNERLPGVDSVDKIDEKFWKRRMKQINHFEKTLALNGTIGTSISAPMKRCLVPRRPNMRHGLLFLQTISGIRALLLLRPFLSSSRRCILSTRRSRQKTRMSSLVAGLIWWGKKSRPEPDFFC